MNLQTSKNLGILGVSLIIIDSILLGLTGISAFKNMINFYSIPRLIGISLVLISLYHFANIYQTKTIYTNARNGAALAIIGTILTYPVTLSLLAIKDTRSPWILLAGLLIMLAILAVFFTVSAIFIRRSLNELAIHSGIDEFTTAGQTLYIGAILIMIIFGITIIGVAFLILAKAFYKMKKTQTTTPIDNRTNFCPNCGTPTSPDTIFCTHCGKQK